MEQEIIEEQEEFTNPDTTLKSIDYFETARLDSGPKIVENLLSSLDKTVEEEDKREILLSEDEEEEETKVEPF